jgi:hypothetical protein
VALAVVEYRGRDDELELQSGAANALVPRLIAPNDAMWKAERRVGAE